MINAENLWKSFPLARDRPGFKEFIVNAPRFFRNNKDCYWALKGVNLAVRKGECLGVIGNNGAGKSTLLSLVLGVAQPTKGRIEVNGKITPLLELGAGFHPDLTGMENIIINGVLLGHTEEEVLDRMNDIIAFSELGDFIEMPTRIYSTGMQMRLAFSIAIHTDPEILLIDEILAVGDTSFQKKCGKALMKLIKGGVATVYVSRSMDAITKICERVIWLEHGEIRAEGEAGSVVEEYLRSGL
ncbi:teichoic acids export ATP-binding protein TagH [bacterium BMS3Bbin07]|nr:teichoic acids export ATP-binding protein TagH [bacterium BMS3Bbin07]